MGHKVNPIGLRVGINRTWDSRWYASRGEYPRLLHEDIRIRQHIMEQQRQAGISKVVIERPHKKCRVTVHTARPGVLIGKKGEMLKRIGTSARLQIERMTETKVFLELFVKVQPNWRESRGFVEELDWRRQLQHLASSERG